MVSTQWLHVELRDSENVITKDREWVQDEKNNKNEQDPLMW